MTLRAKILCLIFGILFFFGLTVTIFINTEFSDRLSGELQKRGVSIAKHIAEESARAILEEDTLSLRLIARDRMKSEEDIVYIFFLTGNGEHVLAHSFGEGFPIDLIGVNRLLPDSDHAIRILGTEYGSVYDIAVPVLKGGLGQVRVGMSGESVSAAVHAIATEILSLAALLLVAGGAAAIPLSRAVAEPIHRLIGATEEIAQGRLDREVTVRSRDEVGALANSFNRMVQNLNAARTQLEKTNEELAKAVRVKGEFVSAAAHEFQTPLTAILGFTELLMQPGGRTEGEAREYLSIIAANAERLSRIVDDLLDIGRIEGGHGFSLHLRSCRIAQTIRTVVDGFRLRSRRHHFVLRLADDQAELSADEDRLTQVLENLLSNAVKYSPSGGTICISGEEEGAFYRIRITDEGKGMTQDQIARIFDKFYRADTSDTAPAGTGLGMPIVRSIVELHHGAIEVVSAPGEGTRVDIFLPVREPSAIAAAASG